jgi:amino acid transporter
MVVVGSFVGWYFDRRADRSAKPESTKQLGVLLASGLIVGESIVGVLIAALVAFADKLGFSNQQAPLSLVGPGFEEAAQWIGGIAFAAIVFIMYRWVARMAGKLGNKS